MVADGQINMTMLCLIKQHWDVAGLGIIIDCFMLSISYMTHDKQLFKKMRQLFVQIIFNGTGHYLSLEQSMPCHHGTTKTSDGN